jgi:hypothetical protein
MNVRSFFKHLCLSFLKAALIGTGLDLLITAYQVYSFFNKESAIVDCPDLGVDSHIVDYNKLDQNIINHLVFDIVSDNFKVIKRPSGLYAAKSKIITKELYIGKLQEFPPFQVPVNTAHLAKIEIKEIPIHKNNASIIRREKMNQRQNIYHVMCINVDCGEFIAVLNPRINDEPTEVRAIEVGAIEVAFPFLFANGNIIRVKCKKCGKINNVKFYYHIPE